jgi:hypothetical protein
MTDETIEQEIQAKGLTAPRVTLADIEREVLAEQFHVFDGTMLTVCCLTLKNGFTVTGESACASPENFDAEIGRKIARQNAVVKIWPLLGFRLRDELARPVLTEADAAADLAGTPRPA